ncbi:MAG: ATP-binding protein, partial [Bacteroidetes bacterium]|nr:ATP-binding protein [Bacteroidota bacterium]
MGFKNFRLVVIGRVLLISLTLFLLFYLGLQTSLHATAAIVALLVIAQIYSLIKYIERTNNDLVRFLSSIRYADFTQSFSARGRGRSFGELSAAISAVMNDFRRVRAEKEEQFQYLQTVVQHIGVGLVVFRQDGEVELVNTAAKRLLNVNHLINIKDLSAVSPALVDTLFAMRPGEKTLFKLDHQSEITQLAIHATSFRLREQYTTLVSLQNIRTELEEKEMEAWQKLIR